MALQARWWVMAGSLALALAPSASAQSVVPGEVLDVPISTRLLMTFRAPSAASWDLSDLPMSTRLLMSFRDQPVVPWYRSDVPMSTRLLMSFRSESAAVPGRFVTPIPYPVPHAFPAPWEMGAARSALEPVQVTTVTLRPDTAPPTVTVKPDTVVTWVNASDREHTLVIETIPPPGGSDWTHQQIGTARPNGSVSLMFHQPGSYEYYLQDQPASRGRIVVAP